MLYGVISATCLLFFDVAGNRYKLLHNNVFKLVSIAIISSTIVSLIFMSGHAHQSLMSSFLSSFLLCALVAAGRYIGLFLAVMIHFSWNEGGWFISLFSDLGFFG